MAVSLWGEEFSVKKTPPKKVIDKVSKPKDSTKVVQKISKSSSLSDIDRLRMIKTNVERILGRYAERTQVIRGIDEFREYIDKAIQNGEIAIDTETNNSLDPITCKLMGPCIYTPGMKNAYIPVNHIDPITHNKLDNQITEEQIREEFSRLSNTKIIMHNGKL